MNPADPPARPIRRILLHAALAVLVTRLILIASVGIAVWVSEDRLPPDAWRAIADVPLLDGWARWDSGWYGGIAIAGYPDAQAVAEGGQRNTAFFPLYPLAMRALAPVFGGNVHLAGLAISHLCFLGAMLMLGALWLRWHGERHAIAALWLFAAFPFAFFFSAAYTEALFLALAVGAFLLADRNRFFCAAVVAALAGATRVPGFLAAGGVALMLLERAPGRLSARLAKALGVLAIGALGPLAYMAFLWRRYGDPFEFLHAHSAAGWAGSSPLLPRNAGEAVLFAAGIVSLGIAAARLRRKPRAAGIWAVAMVVLAFNSLPSMGRLLSVVFPMFAVVAWWLAERRLLLRLAIAAGLAAQIALAIRFALWRWVA